MFIHILSLSPSLSLYIYPVWKELALFKFVILRNKIKNMYLIYKNNSLKVIENSIVWWIFAVSCLGEC